MMSKAPKRPVSVTAILVLVLTFTGMQILRVWSAIASWDFLSSLPLSVSPLYFLLSGLFWAIVGGALVWGLWLRKPWAPRATIALAVAFAIAHWLDRLFLQASGPQSGNQGFDFLLTLVLLATVWLNVALPQVRAYFGAKNGKTLKA